MAKLSIIVPVYNEAPHLERWLDTFLAGPCPLEREWIFIDDGSTDGSRGILEAHSRRRGFRVIPMGKNRGKGSAVAKGIREATGDFILVQDADFETDPADVPKLLAPILVGRADVVFGSRFLSGERHGLTGRRYLANRFLTSLSNWLTGLRLTDMETCYKLFRADLLKAMPLQSRRFEIEVELTARIAKMGVRLEEVPISYHPRRRTQGKKITWRDGVAAIYYLFRYNLISVS